MAVEAAGASRYAGRYARVSTNVLRGTSLPKEKQQVPPLRYAPVGMTPLTEGRNDSTQTELSSRPERTRISCHAALDKAACAPFCKGKAHEVHQRHQVPQEIRGSVVEGPAVSPAFKRVSQGIASYPECIRLFPRLTLHWLALSRPARPIPGQRRNPSRRQKVRVDPTVRSR
jgi:hypothetical protein